MYEDICLHCGRQVDADALYCSAECEALELASPLFDSTGSELDRADGSYISVRSTADNTATTSYNGQFRGSHSLLRGDTSADYSRYNHNRSSLSSSSVSSVISTPASPALPDDDANWKELDGDVLDLSQGSRFDIGLGTGVATRHQVSLSPPSAFNAQRKYLNRRSVDSIDPALFNFDKLTYARRPSATNTRSTIPSPMPPVSQHGRNHRRAFSGTVPDYTHNALLGSAFDPSSTSTSASRSRSRSSITSRLIDTGLKSAPVAFTGGRFQGFPSTFADHFSIDKRPKVSKSMSERRQHHMEVYQFHSGLDVSQVANHKNKHHRGRASLPSHLSLLQIGLSAPATPVISKEMAHGQTTSPSPPLFAVDYVHKTKSEPVPNSPTATLRNPVISKTPSGSYSTTPVTRFRKLALISDDDELFVQPHAVKLSRGRENIRDLNRPNRLNSRSTSDSERLLDHHAHIDLNLSTTTIKDLCDHIEAETEVPRGRSRARRGFSPRERPVYIQPQIGLGFGFGASQVDRIDHFDQLCVINERRPVDQELYSKVLERGRTESRGRCRLRKERDFTNPRMTSWAPVRQRSDNVLDRGT